MATVLAYSKINLRFLSCKPAEIRTPGGANESSRVESRERTCVLVVAPVSVTDACVWRTAALQERAVQVVMHREERQLQAVRYTDFVEDVRGRPYGRAMQ